MTNYCLFFVTFCVVLSLSYATTLTTRPEQRHTVAPPRRLQNNRPGGGPQGGGTTVSNNCAQLPASLYTCQDPTNILSDPTIVCNPQTCLWDLTALDPTKEPAACTAYIIIPSLVNNLPDLLEPCLWWEMLYGALQPTSAPTLSPQPTSMPTTVAPTMDPTGYPSPSPSASPTVSQAPTRSPTKGPTWAPTELPSDLPSTMEPTSAPTQSPTQVPTLFPTASLAPTRTMRPTGPTTAPTLQPSKSSYMAVALDTILLNFFVAPARRRRLSSSSLISSELRTLTEQHVMEALGKNGPDATQLVMTNVRQLTLSNATIVYTVALDGSVTIKDPQGVQSNVRQAFTGADLAAYLLMVQSSDDPTLQRVNDITTGPLGSFDSSQESPSNSSVFEWSILWIIIIVVGGVGVLGLCAVGTVLCYRSYHRENGVDIKRKASKDITLSANSSSEVIESPTKDDKANMRDEEEVMEEASLANKSVDQSIMTTYSYKDQSSMLTTDHQDISVMSNDLNYRVGYGEDEEQSTNSSKLWSIVDGLTNESLVSPSPSRMVVSQEDAVEVYEDDEISMVSDYARQDGESLKILGAAGINKQPPKDPPTYDYGRVSPVEENRAKKRSIENWRQVVREGGSLRNKSTENSFRQNTSTASEKTLPITKKAGRDESSDDDSFFMGPDASSKDSKSGSDSSVKSALRRASNVIKHRYRPVAVASKDKLTEKERNTLLGVKEESNTNGGDEENSQSMKLPGSYTIRAETKDDESVSTFKSELPPPDDMSVGSDSESIITLKTLEGRQYTKSSNMEPM